MHKPISAQLLPAAAPNRFSNDTVRGETGRWRERGERDIENNKEAGREREKEKEEEKKKV